MTLPYIWLRCQRSIATRGYHLRRASFVSLGQLVEPGKKESSLLPDRKKGVEDAKRPQQTSYPPKRSRRDHDPQLESLFTSTTRSKKTASDQNAKKFNKDRQPVYAVPARTLVDEQIRTLEHMRQKQKADIIELWKACQELLSSDLWQQMTEDAGSKESVVFSESQLEVFRGILLEAARLRSRYPYPQALPSVYTAVKAYRRYNLMKEWWDQALWEQLSGYIVLDPEYSGKVDVRGHSKAAFEEIIKFWRVMLHDRKESVQSLSEDGAREENTLSPLIAPTEEDEAPQLLDGKGEQMCRGISQRFLEFWPTKYGGNQQIATAAVLTIDILKRRKDDPGWASLNFRARFLVELLNPLVEGGEIEWSSAVKILQEKGFNLHWASRIIRRWSSIPVTVIGLPPENDLDAPHGHSAKKNPGTSTSAGHLSSTLQHAIAKADASAVFNMWRQAEQQIVTEKLEEAHRDELFSQFLSAFFTLKRQAYAVEVWNCMVNVNHQPTRKHWHAMLAGCSAAKDLSSLREVWNNMLSAGVEPNMTTWTTWIHGLMICGDPESGLRALEDLGKTWKAASNETTTASENKLTPSLIPVRAALSGLAQSNNIDLASTVLDFAHSQNLHPDTQIYNIMLRPAVRSNDQPRIQSILRTMSSTSTPPDIATFTIILNGLLSNPTSTFHTQSPSEQKTAIFAILSEMERNDLKPNTYTYSTILDGLLNPQNLNIDAAQAVMQHMTANHIRPSPHVYTILTTHYFALSPPELPAIDSLLHRIKIEKTPLDPIFWDRMIESYARVGETEKMLMVLRRMPEQGQSPGWMALLACLRALVEGREWEAVRELVRDVEDVKGVLRHGSGPWRGKDAFWELVEECRGAGRLEVEER